MSGPGGERGGHVSLLCLPGVVTLPPVSCHPRPSSRRYSAHREGSLRETSSAALECRRLGRGLFGRLSSCRSTGSEKALAALACKRIGANERPEVLIGGLGMGFTLRAALSELGASARIVVAELVPAVVRWARGPLAELFGSSLAEPRVTLHEADVSSVMKRSKSAYAAILLDVDNGPEGLTRESNERLYDVRGLMAARAALRPGGVLAVWSSGPDRSFSKRLRQTGW